MQEPETIGGSQSDDGHSDTTVFSVTAQHITTNHKTRSDTTNYNELQQTIGIIYRTSGDTRQRLEAEVYSSWSNQNIVSDIQ